MEYYAVPWSFYFQFNQKKQIMNIYISSLFKTRESIPHSDYVLGYEDITTFLHKYDLRKLNYFFDIKAYDTFDMTLKVKDFSRKKGYIKLHALCYIKDNVMHCVSIEYMEVIKVKKMLDKHILRKNVHLEIKDPSDVFKDIENKKLVALEEHLYDLIYRTYTN